MPAILPSTEVPSLQNVHRSKRCAVVLNLYNKASKSIFQSMKNSLPNNYQILTYNQQNNTEQC